ncbi:MAG: TetR/AcrR family transcriptional regulator [Pseudomonadota bacterium]
MDDHLHTTPAERRRLQVREAIVSAAEEVFSQEGEEGLSIRRLADSINYSPAAIYKYFGSKEELLDELKESFFGRLVEHIHATGDGEDGYIDRARACFATYIRTAIDKPHHYAAAFAGHALPNALAPGVPEFAETKKGEAFLFLSGMLQEGVDLGHFPQSMDATLAAKSAWAAMHGLSMMLAHMPTFPAFGPDDDTMTPDEFIDFYCDLIIRGLEVDHDRP